MGLFKKRFQKNVSRDNIFLKDYATKVNGLLIFSEGNENVTKELEALKNDFQYTVPTASKDAKSLEKKIVKEFNTLSATLSAPEWEESEVILAVKGIRKMLADLSSLR